MRAFQFRLQRTYACPIIPGTEVRIFALVKPASAYLMLKQKLQGAKVEPMASRCRDPRKRGFSPSTMCQHPSKSQMELAMPKPDPPWDCGPVLDTKLLTRQDLQQKYVLSVGCEAFPLLYRIWRVKLGKERLSHQRGGNFAGKICCGFYSWALVKPFSQNVFRLLTFNTPNTTSCWAQISPFCWLIALRWGVLTVKLPVKKILILIFRIAYLYLADLSVHAAMSL